MRPRIFLRVSSGPHKSHKYYRIVLQVIRNRQSPDETIRNLTKILAICPESGDRRIRFGRRVRRSPTRYSESHLSRQMKNGFRIKSRKAPPKFAERRRSTRRSPPLHSPCSPFRERVFCIDLPLGLVYALARVFTCVRACVCICACMRMCVPCDVSPSWCGASLLRPCLVYFPFMFRLRPRWSTISCHVSFSSSSSSAWMQLVKYCVVKQSCLRRGQRSRKTD